MKLSISVFISLLFFLFNVQLIVAQLPSAEASVYTAEDGKLFWNKELPVYVRLATTPDDKGVLLKSENHTDYVNPIYLDTEGVNYFRARYAVDQETKEVVSPKIEILMEVYADGTAPKTIDKFLAAPQYVSNDVRYIGQNLKVNLSSNDRYAGVNEIYYSSDGSSYQVFENDIPYNEEGPQILSFLSIDNVGNIEEKNSKAFTIDLSSPTSFHNVNGIADNYIIGLSSTIYLTIEDNLSGVNNTFYKFDDEEFNLYDGKTLKINHLNDGEHTLEYYSVDNVKNEETSNKFVFYYDKIAPITVADVLGDRYIADGKVYLSGRTKMKLTAVDNKAGVKEKRFSIDGGEFQVYDQPFYLPSVSGEHLVRYYSLDNMSNQTVGKDGRGYEEFKHSVSKVYLDLTGPNLNHGFEGNKFQTRDTMFINRSTEIVLRATDNESGLQYISYSLNGASEENRYVSPFTISETGIHNIEVFGYDNVNNRNITTFYCLVDGEAPIVINKFSVLPIAKRDGIDVYPPYVKLYLAATDESVGTDNIYYFINQTGEKLYTKAITGFKKNTKYKISFRSIDLLGNESTSDIEFYTGD